VRQTKFHIYERRLDVWQHRPELAGYIATITQLWSGIEYQLAIIFVILSGSSLALGRVFSDIVGIHTRLRILSTLINAFITDKDDRDRYNALESRVIRASKVRNNIVHGIWSIRDGKPDRVFLQATFPLTMAEARPVAYTRQRFVDTANSFLCLYKNLAEFDNHVSTLHQQQPFPRPFPLRK
jgi:hypothetical protein